MKYEGGGLGDINYFTTRSWFPEEAAARPPGAQGNACEPRMGLSLGTACPAGTE